MDKIRFGVEFERVLRPKEEVIPLLVEHFHFDLTEHEKDVVPLEVWHRHDNRFSVIEFLRCYLQQGEQSEYANAGPEVGNYTAWTVVYDPSIEEERFTYGIELVSPIFTSNIGPSLCDATGDWRYELGKLWAKIEHYFDIVTASSHYCGTHIHVSPIEGFTVSQVRKFARFLVKYHETMTGLIPTERLQQPYAKPNFQVRPEPTMDDLKETSLKDLVESLMPRLEDYGEHGNIADAKYVAWNFLPLLGPKGTIEFRQPPHVTQFGDAERWIQLCLNFFHRALNQRF